MDLEEEIEATYNTVKKVTGSIQPVGETHRDEERFMNLQVLTGVVDRLLTDIDTVATENKDRVEFSMNRSGKFADAFLDKIGIKQ